MPASSEPLLPPSGTSDWGTGRRLIVVVSAVLCCLFNAGLAFGFSALLPVLIDSGAFHDVWCVLKDLHEFPPLSVYSVLYMDWQAGRNILGCALMRFVPEQDIQVAQQRARETGHAGDASIYKSLSASHKLPLLHEFAKAVGLRLDDLLEPRTFIAEEHS